jgi:hypothetical protein
MFIYSAKKITAHGYSVIRLFGEVKELKVSKTVRVIKQNQVDYKKEQFKAFSTMYPVEFTKTIVTLYKAVHKIDGKYIADYDKKTEYVIGENKEIPCDSSTDVSCSNGIHVSYKMWAINFGQNWEDMALLECEVAIKDIVVGSDCDGKVRTSKIKVIREVPKTEY